MDSSNFRHQHQLLGSSSSPSSSSSSLATPPCYEISTSITNLNDGDQLINQIDQNYNSRQKNEIFQQWTSNNVYNNNNNNSDHNHHARNIKDESFSSPTSSEYSFPRFSEILTSSSRDLNDLSEKLLLQTLSPGFPMFSPENHHFFASSRAQNGARSSSVPCISGNFSQIYPSINISSLNQVPPPSCSENIPGSDLQALDLLPPARFGNQPSFDPLHMHQPSHATKVSSSTLIEPKRSPSSLPEPKPTQAAAKKSRMEHRTSCPPFKVRKEKLGDRIAALQQLVAPYGKTDTASVLMEAIGYIQFLQNQVETLSVPYMKLSRNKSINRSKQVGITMEEGNSEEPGQDLRSRGLCLVPLSCMTYLTGDGGGGIWPPPNFGGGT